MTEFFGPLMFILNMSGTMVLLFKEKIEKLIPMSFILSAMVLFPFGFLRELSLGTYILVGISLSGPLYLITEKVIKKKDISQWMQLILTSGLFIFILVYAAVYVINLKRNLNSWDEFSFWGPKIKEMLRLDAYYSVKEAAPHSHQDYPPAIQLTEFLWCKMCGGVYRERTLYRSLQTFLLSLYLPVFALPQIRTGQWYKSFVQLFLAAALIMICPLVMDSNLVFYNRICVDYALSIITAYIIADIVLTERYTQAFFFRLAVSLSFLILSKQIALLLHLLSAGILFSFIIIRNKHTIRTCSDSKGIEKRIVISAAAVCIIPFIFRQIWSYYVKDVSQLFKISDINISSMFSIMKGTGGEAYQHLSFVNFIDKLLTFNIADRPAGMTYWQIALLLAGLTLLLHLCRLYAQNDIAVINCMMLMGAAAYAFAMLVIYIYCFKEIEGPATASYSRYMDTYLAGWRTVIIMLAVYGLIKAGKYHISSAFACVFLLLACTVSGASMKETAQGLAGHDYLADCRTAENVICKNTPENSKILYVCQGDNGWNYVKLRYLGLPRTSSSISMGDPSYYSTNQIYVSDLSLDEAKKCFLQYDYVYLHVIDEQFIKRYGSLFGREELTAGQLYKVADENASCNLQIVDNDADE